MDYASLVFPSASSPSSLLGRLFCAGAVPPPHRPLPSSSSSSSSPSPTSSAQPAGVSLERPESHNTVKDTHSLTPNAPPVPSLLASDGSPSIHRNHSLPPCPPAAPFPVPRIRFSSPSFPPPLASTRHVARAFAVDGDNDAATFFCLGGGRKGGFSSQRRTTSSLRRADKRDFRRSLSDDDDGDDDDDKWHLVVVVVVLSLVVTAAD